MYKIIYTFLFPINYQGSYANFGSQNPDFILTKKSDYPDFQNDPETGFGLKTLPYMVV